MAARPIKGRGASGNPGNRFDGSERIVECDGWWAEDADPAPATTVTAERARTIITRNSSPDIPFDRSINPYQGCEHGCIYCYARPSHAHYGLSPGLDFETRLFAKGDAARLLTGELARPGYRPTTIMLGANTDPYQPVERRQRITRSILAVLAACRHPLAITTKSALIVRDLDLLAAMAADQLVSVGLSITTLDPGLARRLEPRATAPQRRLRAIAALTAAGVPVTVMAAPMIPFVNDHELEAILAAAAAAGASAAAYTLVRLPHEVAPLFAAWLATHLPERARRVDQAIRACHDGRRYRAGFGRRMTGDGPYADLLGQRFAVGCRRLGLATASAGQRPLATHLFRPPPRATRLIGAQGILPLPAIADADLADGDLPDGGVRFRGGRRRIDAVEGLDGGAGEAGLPGRRARP